MSPTVSFSSLRCARAAILAAACMLALAAPAAAQWRVLQAPSSGDAPRGRAGMLHELAGTLGAVHYLAVVCEGRGNQYWRERMMTLLDAEAADRFLRAAMIEAFNDQYRASERAFPSCSGAARTAQRESAERGLFLAEALGAPYR